MVSTLSLAIASVPRQTSFYVEPNDFLQNLHNICSALGIPPNPIAGTMTSPQDPDLDYFLSIPWCERLLADPAVIIIPTPSRDYKPNTEDAFFAETLKTDDTIKACVSFYKPPSREGARIEEIHALFTLGYRVNGYAHVAHGGLVATIVDEIMGTLISLNQRRKLLPRGGNHVTAYLNLTYKKAVATPQAVLVSARFREVAGRKHFIDAAVKDGHGSTLASAEALFIDINNQGKL